MSRGLDIEEVENVINYDVPPFVTTYVHRYYVNSMLLCHFATYSFPYILSLSLSVVFNKSQSWKNCKSRKKGKDIHTATKRGSAPLQSYAQEDRPQQSEGN